VRQTYRLKYFQIQNAYIGCPIHSEKCNSIYKIHSEKCEIILKIHSEKCCLFAQVINLQYGKKSSRNPKAVEEPMGPQTYDYFWRQTGR
jgi:hypothetical protein